LHPLYPHLTNVNANIVHFTGNITCFSFFIFLFLHFFVSTLHMAQRIKSQILFLLNCGLRNTRAHNQQQRKIIIVIGFAVFVRAGCPDIYGINRQIN